jgi:hypothetical protein
MTSRHRRPEEPVREDQSTVLWPCMLVPFTSMQLEPDLCRFGKFLDSARSETALSFSMTRRRKRFGGPSVTYPQADASDTLLGDGPCGEPSQRTTICLNDAATLFDGLMLVG